MSNTWSSYRYAPLAQEDQEATEEMANPEEPKMEFGMPEGTFQSIFTYANYNNLDNMGYQAPKRYGRNGIIKNANFTYSHRFDTEEIEVQPMNAVELIIYGFSLLLAVITLPFSLFFTLKFVGSSENLVIMRLGRAQKPKGSGVAFVLPCIDSTHIISTSVTAFNVPPLQIITVDRGLIELGATVFLKIRDPLSAICGIQDRNAATRTLANSMLYRYFSRKRICEISNPQDRRIVTANFKDELGSFTGQFGIEITNVELSELKIVKEGENLGLSALSAVANSETGKQLWNVVGPHIEEFASFAKQQNEEEAAKAKKDDLLIEPISTLSSIPEETIDIDRLLSSINLAIDEPLTRSIGRVFLIECDDMDSIVIDLKHLPGHAAKGKPLTPIDVTFRSSSSTFIDIIRKRTSPISAYMNGSLKISGQIQDALSLRHLAERVAELL